jgi:hypothetical protein
MVGKNHKSAVLVVTDRKSRFNKLRKLDGKHAKKVTRETAKALKGLPIKTMSNDRGQEFSDHQNYEKKSKVKVYFCDPYSSYQRGTNENRIGAIRQYLPKKTEYQENEKTRHQTCRDCPERQSRLGNLKEQTKSGQVRAGPGRGSYRHYQINQIQVQQTGCSQYHGNGELRSSLDFGLQFNEIDERKSKSSFREHVIQEIDRATSQATTETIIKV